MGHGVQADMAPSLKRYPLHHGLIKQVIAQERKYIHTHLIAMDVLNPMMSWAHISCLGTGLRQFHALLTRSRWW